MSFKSLEFTSSGVPIGLALLHVEALEHLLNVFALAHGYGAVCTVSLKLHTEAIVQPSKITHLKFIFKP